MANKAYLEFAEVGKPEGLSNSSQVADRDSPPQVWIVPPTGITKINYDAALPQDNAKGGLGLVLRDHAGELLAVRAALRLALELGLKQVQVESDCREAVNYILDHSCIAPIDSAVVLGDIWKLSTSFSSISFHCISRAINGVADALARKALSLVCLIDWPLSTQWLHELCSREAAACTHPLSQ
ncbi:uncharacterized protein LOC122659473 [Telopea speciosissima]|uniref:uncharacterized protein LOC122659473 n=1 Tax=Telopea speciosissima TaxID=54955 RepID=UPI001CC6C3E7|nr:uncharacterized protein LOC122659473 [Telopea speciosissima]